MVSAKQPVRFQEGQKDGEPEDVTKPVWLVQPCTVWQRPLWEREEGRAGAAPTRPAELPALLRAIVTELKPDGEREAAIRDLDEAQRIADGSSDLPEEEKAAVGTRCWALQQWAAAQDGTYAALFVAWVKAFTGYANHRRLIAGSMFVIGWEGIDVPVERRGHFLSDACLQALADAGHYDGLLAAGGKALALLTLPEAHRKN